MQSLHTTVYNAVGAYKTVDAHNAMVAYNVMGAYIATGAYSTTVAYITVGAYIIVGAYNKMGAFSRVCGSEALVSWTCRACALHPPTIFIAFFALLHPPLTILERGFRHGYRFPDPSPFHQPHGTAFAAFHLPQCFPFPSSLSIVPPPPPPSNHFLQPRFDLPIVSHFCLSSAGSRQCYA